MIALFITLCIIAAIIIAIKNFFAIFGGIIAIGLIVWLIVKIVKKRKKN